MHDDRVADREVGHRRADLVYPAAVLVAEGERQRRVERRVQLAVQDVHIGAADAGAGDADDDVVRIAQSRLRYLGERDGLAVRLHLGGPHADSPSSEGKPLSSAILCTPQGAVKSQLADVSAALRP